MLNQATTGSFIPATRSVCLLAAWTLGYERMRNMCLVRSGGVSCAEDACWGEGSTHRWVLHHALCAHVWSDFWVINMQTFCLGCMCCKCNWVLYCTVFDCCTVSCLFFHMAIHRCRVAFYHICIIFSCNFGLDCLFVFVFVFYKSL